MTQANKDSQMLLKKKKKAPIIYTAEMSETDSIVPADSSQREATTVIIRLRQMVSEMIGQTLKRSHPSPL